VSKRITTEQEQALNELIAQIPARKPVQAVGSELMQLLETWLGISQKDVAQMAEGLLSGKDEVQSQFLDWTESHPTESIFEFLAAASLAFYTAEKEVNPKIQTYVDAFYYISTCASVGYADIFAVTQTGRAIASLVMILGPALSSHAVDRPARTSRNQSEQ
jgi:hypothetical protein